MTKPQEEVITEKKPISQNKIVSQKETLEKRPAPTPIQRRCWSDILPKLKRNDSHWQRKILTEVVAPAFQMKVKTLKIVVQYVIWNILLVVVVSSVVAKKLIAGYSVTVAMRGFTKFVFHWIQISKKVSYPMDAYKIMRIILYYKIKM